LRCKVLPCFPPGVWASKRVLQACELLKYLASPEAAPVLRESGLEK
jgi:hypothetical protein